ncbi:MAG: RNA polymerase-binding protein DksA [Burkholderiaceae bacterium]|nr:RNA polymerase-binding protein DksA [Burkholderiaceae bacterium]
MSVKSKAPVKKAAKKAAPKKPAPKPVKSAVKSVKPAAKPAAKAVKPAAKSAKPAAKATTKSPAKVPAKAVAKPAAKPAKAAPAAPAKKGPGAKALPPLPPKRAPIAAGARPVAPAPVVAPPSPMPAPRPIAPKPQAAVSTKDVAAAHEYLLTRSASRSEAPVIVNGKQLPTEERLLKMPESAYMNDEQLAFFKYRLQQMERELLANADETTEHLRETVIVPDPADRATIEEEHALELRTRDRERKLLKKVQQALGRIESGDYGFCEETGDPIGIPRLLARPTATLSLEAQQRRELKQKLYGD